MTRSRMWNAGTAAVVVLILLAGWFLAIAPQRSAAAESRAEAETIAEQNEVTEDKIEALKLAQKDVPDQIADIAEIRKQLPADVAQPALLRQLAQIAEDSGAEVFNVSPSAIEELEGVEGVRFATLEVTGRGRFESLQIMLSKIEENSRAMLVTGFNIAPAEPREGEDDNDVLGVLDITLTMRIFMSDPATAAPGGAAGAGAEAGTPVAPSSTTQTN